MRLDGLALLQPIAVKGVWYRSSSLEFLPSIMDTTHTLNTASRFSNPRDLSGLAIRNAYFAETSLDAQIEARFFTGRTHDDPLLTSDPNYSVVTINARINLDRVLDLTALSNVTLLQTSYQELTGDWRAYDRRRMQDPAQPPSAPTQQLGMAAFRAGFQGILTYSATWSLHRNLVIFSEHCKEPGMVSWLNPLTQEFHNLT